MTKKELFLKYNINESHNEWNLGVDDWTSVELYRIMHDGELPDPEDLTVIWICDFLDKQKDMKW